jgi:hypothetical protein
MKVKFLNWWDSGRECFFSNFCKHHFGAEVTAGDDADILFISVFGKKEYAINYVKSNPHIKCKIFFTGENTESPGHLAYNDYLFKDIDLALGFKKQEAVNNPKYLEFPLWLFYFNLSPQQIFSHRPECCLDKLDLNRSAVPVKFCALINSTDQLGNRVSFLKELNEYKKCDVCALGGKLWEHRTILEKIPASSKIKFLQDYKFNICFENSKSAGGYNTEKLPEALLAKTIPLYWGDPIDERIFNAQRLIYIKEPRRPDKETLSLIKELDQDPSAYLEFVNQDCLSPSALKIINGIHDTLLIKMKKLLNANL